LHDSESNEKYFGKIGKELAKRIDEISLNFKNTIYECKLEVVYYPETSLSKEKTEYTLLDISEVNE
jgi:hypothetical protein